MPQLPTRRSDVVGSDLDGNRVRLALSIARKLYVCPGCRARLEIGTEHVVVERASSDDRFHQHWHTACAESLAREIEIASELSRKKR